MPRLSALLLGAATLSILTTSAASPALTAELAGRQGLSSLPTAAQATISGVLGRDSRKYQAGATAAGFRSENRTHGLVADFTESGVVVKAGAGRIGLSLRSLGYGKQLSPVAAARPEASKNRVEYRRGTLTEWYVNGPLGLEQGFTLTAPPAKRTPDPLTLALTLSGTLRASLTTGASGLELALAAKPASLRYRGLAAWDASGRELPAWLALEGRTLVVRVDDAAARYPLTIDPIFEQAKLAASDGGAFDLFGSSVAVSGDTVVVGAPYDDVGGTPDQGSAYVFVEPGGGWASGTQTAKLTASGAAEHDLFGSSVAVSGGTVVVGASDEDGTGSAYVYVKPGGGWVNATQTAKLTASDAAESDLVGTSVAVSGDTVVVGAPGDDISATQDQGSAYVYVKPGGGWVNATQTAKLTVSGGQEFDAFGSSVGMSGDTIVGGAPYGDSTAADRGAAYVYVKPGGGWVNGTQTAKLTASDGEDFDQFGEAVSVSGDTAVVGARNGDGATMNQGAAYVYVKPGGGWVDATQTAKLTASDGAAGDALGNSVAVSGDTVAVGSYFDEVGTTLVQGSAYLFLKPGGGWANGTETDKLIASDGASGDLLGNSVSVSGDTVAVGAYNDDVGGTFDQGSAYVFPVSAPATPGELRVTTNPAVASQILIDDVIRNSWGLDWLQLPPGTYTLSFTHIEGYTEPAPQQVTITAGQTTTVNATFTQRGSLRVITSPAVPGTISVDGVPRNNWGLWTDIPVGNHQVCFGDVADFTTPACENANVTAGQLTTITGNYVANPGAPGETGKGELRVTTNPAVASQILIDGVIANSWGLDWLKLPAGTYTLSFTHIEGYTEPAPQQVTITAGQTTTVNASFTQRGSLRVITSPPVHGTISVDGVPRNDWGMWTDIPTGSHQVCFGAVTGFTTPACQNATVNAGQLTTVTGTYS